jgi:hypothetical protein
MRPEAPPQNLDGVEEKDADDDKDELLHNLNMYSVLSWKLAVHKFGNAARMRPLEKVHNYFTVSLLRLLPIVLVWCEVVILIGILDEGAKLKYLSEHDKTFQFPRFIWTKSSPHSQCQAEADMQQWFQDQANSEVPNCAYLGIQLANFSAAYSFSQVDFFDRYETSFGAKFSEDLTYVLTHCFPWAYGDLCRNILSTRATIEASAALGLGGCNPQRPGVWDNCAYRACYMPQEATSRFGGDSRIVLNDWRAVQVSLTEVYNLAVLAGQIQSSTLIPNQRKALAAFQAAYQTSALRSTYAANSNFICWMMAQQMNRRKNFASKAEDISIYLFQKLHWVYAHGVGDTYAIELLAIIFLSFYVYTTSLFDELMQLLYQLRANVVFSGRERMGWDRGVQTKIDR